MNMKRFSSAILIIVLVISFVFAGCSAGNSSTPDEASPKSPYGAADANEELSLPAKEKETTVNTEPTTIPEETDADTEGSGNSGTGSGSSGGSGSGSGSAPSGVTVNERCTITVGNKGYVVDKGDTVTYTFKLKTPQKIEDVQATLSYDSSYLKLKSSDDAESIFPVLGFSTIYNINLDSSVKFNAVKISGFDFTTENTLVTLEFEVLKNGGTAISTDIEIMTAVDGTLYADNYVLSDEITCKETLTK